MDPMPMMMLPAFRAVPTPAGRARPALHAAALMLLLSAAGSAPAQDEPGMLSLPTPEVPSGPYPGDSVGAPEVTIRETETEVIYEYRVKGRVYMVKIDPIIGPPYYLLDTNGDGTLDVQEQDVPDMALPQWLLFSW
jgi:hypothetical protein